MAYGQQQLHSWQRRTVHKLDAQAQRHLLTEPLSMPGHRLYLRTHRGYALAVAGAALRAGRAPDRG